MTGLFRPEAAEARRPVLEGEVILSQTLSLRLMILGLIATVALIIGIVASGSFARTETAVGMLVADSASAKIIAPTPGVITELLVKEGSRVTKHSPLAVVGLDRRDQTGQAVALNSTETIEERVRLVHDQIALAHERSKNDRTRIREVISSNQAKLAEVRSQIALQEELVRSSATLFDQLKAVVEKGYVSKVTYEQRRQAMLSARQYLASLRQQEAALKAELSSPRADYADSLVDERRTANDLSSSIESLKERQAEARGEQSYSVEAPISGFVTALQTGVGKAVRPDLPLMIVVPEHSQLSATLYAPTRAIGFIKSGDEVRLLYDAFPYQRFGSFKGKVVGISRINLDPRDLDVPLKIDEPVYRITVSLPSQTVPAFGVKVPLQAGMTLHATLILERQTLLEWLLSPLRAVTRRNS